jgi:hypothetical protein
MPALGQPRWQPISALPILIAHIREGVRLAEEHLERLREAQSCPHVLDEATVSGVRRTFGQTREDLVTLFVEQGQRWAQLELGATRRRDVEHYRALVARQLGNGGGNPGPGRAVALADLNQAGAEAVAADIRAGGGTAMALGLDVTDSDAVKAALDQVVATFGRLDVAFNNAGIEQRHTTTVDTTEADFDRLMTVTGTPTGRRSRSASAVILMATSSVATPSALTGSVGGALGLVTALFDTTDVCDRRCGVGTVSVEHRRISLRTVSPPTRKALEEGANPLG